MELVMELLVMCRLLDSIRMCNGAGNGAGVLFL
jgi:hypothetical protein